jgi:hypothetical protein
MGYLQILITLLFAVVALSPTRADPVEDRLRSEASREAAALQRSDFDTVLTLTYPKVVEMMGGREKAKEMLTTTIEQIKSKGISFESVTVGDPQKPFGAKGKLFSIIPMTVVMSAPDRKLAQRSFLLAVSSDAGV